MTKKIDVLIVEESVVSLTQAVISCLAREKNIRIHCLSFGDHKYPPFRFSRYLDTFIRQPSADDSTVYEQIRSNALGIHADIIVPVNEKIVQILSARLGELPPGTRVQPLPEPGTLELIRNKWLLYNWLYTHNFSSYQTHRYVDLRNHPELPLDYPILVKPFWGSGGEGIVLIRNQTEFLHFKPNTRFPETELLVQPVIEGIDIDISLLAVNGIIKVFAIQKGKNKKTNLKYSWQIEFLEDASLFQLTAEIITKLKYTGIAHLDYRGNEDKKEYTLVDFNARYWTTLTGALNAGLNFPVMAVYEGLGLEYEKMKARNGNYSKTSNVISIIGSRFSGEKASRVRYKESELLYSIKDPLPCLLDFFLKILSYLGTIRKHRDH